MMLNYFISFSINFNAQHVNGMTPFYSCAHVRVLDTQEYRALKP